MPSALTVGAGVVLVGGAIFQVYLSPVVFNTFGVGRVVQPLSDFPEYSCRKIVHPLLEGCEDLRLDDAGRKLYLACSDPEGRIAWTPTVNRRNVSGRIGNDRMVVMDIDHPGAKKDYSPKKLTMKGYKGALKDAEIDLHGFDIEPVTSAADGTLRFFLVNHRPPVDAERQALDAQALGCNSTVEVFELPRGSTELQHKHTFFAPESLKTPNRVAATGEGGFVSTNDHGTRAGPFRQLEPISGRGSLAFCGLRTCHIATPERMVQPNGITKNPVDGLYYVPSSIAGTLRVFRLDPPNFGTSSADRLLREVATVQVKMPMDNLNVDASGAIWAGAFPKAQLLIDGFDKPRNSASPVTAWKITRAEPVKNDKGEEVFNYDVVKAWEDGNAEVASGVTTVLHDSKTGSLFMGGVYMPWVTVCERTKKKA